MASTKKNKKLKPFAVVLFESENRYATVPRTWISEDGDFCSWPPASGKLNVNSLAQDPLSSPTPTWKQHRVSYVKYFDSFKSAEEKSEDLKDPSKLELQSSDTDTFRSPAVPSKSLKAKKNRKKNTSSDVGEVLVVNNNNDTAEATVPEPDINAETSDSGGPQGVNDPDLNETFTSSFTVDTITLASSQDLQELKLSINQQTEGLQSAVEVMLTKLEEIIADVADTKRQLRQILSQISPQGPSVETHKYSTLPIKDFVELELTETALTDPEQFQKLVAELKRIGGSTIPKTVYNTLRHLLSNELSKNLRLTDKSGKRPFGSLLVAQCVRIAVQSLWSGTAVTDTVVNDCIGTFFRNTNPRQKKTHGDSKNNEEKEDSGNSEDNNEEDPAA